MDEWQYDNSPQINVKFYTMVTAGHRREITVAAWLLACVAAYLISCGAASAGSRGQRPNILFCISDDQSWLHTGFAGDPVIKTPVFDRIAREGVYFTNAYCSAPSCTASRGSILTGRYFWQLGRGANLHSSLPAEFPVYTELLEQAGYHVGFMRKGWSPGDIKPGGRKRNPAGKRYKTFNEFIEARPDGEPFCFWFGSSDPHRKYVKGSGAESGMRPNQVVVPPFFPDTAEVRNDILDYYFEIQRFDREVGELVDRLRRAGELDNTIVVITSDNGMPFPRCKTNLYDYGVRMPLAIRWRQKIKGGRVVTDFVNFADFAPTFLEAVGIQVPAEMTGRSFYDVLLSRQAGRVDAARNHVVVGRERHVPRVDGSGYPMRALRTDNYLYIRNFKPERWPAGGPGWYADVDPSPTKKAILAGKEDRAGKRYYDLAFAKRPAEELYFIPDDPGQVNNLAENSLHAGVKSQLASGLADILCKEDDPRAFRKPVTWDTDPYYGKWRPSKKKGKSTKP